MSSTPTAPPPHPTLWQAFLYWLRLGFISFGGPAGQIAVMHQELVERRRWISERRFLHALNYCMVLPGPEAQQLATYIGWLLHRGWGGVIAGVLFVLPSLLILILLTWGYLLWGSVPVVAGVLAGIKPAVVAIIWAAALRIGSRALRHWLLWAVAALSFLATATGLLPFPLLVLAAALIGAAGGRWAPRIFVTGGHAATKAHHGPALIDDDTPTPPHARYRPQRLLRVLASGALIWLAAMAALVALQGVHGPFTQMGLFFSQAALLTFGGAYAVLPYVVQGAVQTHGWATAGQMLDGLALGETTPGPLIMIVAFVGFVGGWTQQVFGPHQLFWAGAAAATVVTFFTFLPSFIFILAGGPLVEATHGDLKFTAPLTGITAAVVGVILNLGLFFATHVLWPRGWAGGLDPFAACIAVAAFAALARFQVSIPRVVLAAALVGALRSLS